MKKYHTQSKLELKHIFRSFKNAFRGLSLLFRYEYNLYIELFFGFVALVLAYLLHISSGEWILLVIVIGLVVFAELTNTTVEKIMDFIHPEYHNQVRDIKDLAAGSVVFTVVIACIVGAFIFLPKIF